MSTPVFKVQSLSVSIRDVSSPGETPDFRMVVLLAMPNHQSAEIELTPATALALSQGLSQVSEVIEAQRMLAFGTRNGIPHDGQICATAINLEGLPDSDLVLASRHPGLHLDLRTMATLMLKARSKRRAGNIQDALTLERRIDRMYETLPGNLRW